MCNLNISAPQIFHSFVLLFVVLSGFWALVAKFQGVCYNVQLMLFKIVSRLYLLFLIFPYDPYVSDLRLVAIAHPVLLFISFMAITANSPLKF